MRLGDTVKCAGEWLYMHTVYSLCGALETRATREKPSHTESYFCTRAERLWVNLSQHIARRHFSRARSFSCGVVENIRVPLSILQLSLSLIYLFFFTAAGVTAAAAEVREWEKALLHEPSMNLHRWNVAWRGAVEPVARIYTSTITRGAVEAQLNFS